MFSYSSVRSSPHVHPKSVHDFLKARENLDAYAKALQPHYTVARTLSYSEKINTLTSVIKSKCSPDHLDAIIRQHSIDNFHALFKFVFYNTLNQHHMHPDMMEHVTALLMSTPAPRTLSFLQELLEDIAGKNLLAGIPYLLTLIQSLHTSSYATFSSFRLALHIAKQHQHVVFIRTVHKLLKTTPSDEAELFSARLPDGNTGYFERHQTSGYQNNCGFYALPIAGGRPTIIKRLLNAASNPDIRNMIAVEIREALIVGELPTILKNNPTYKTWVSNYNMLAQQGSTHQKQMQVNLKGLERYTSTEKAYIEYMKTYQNSNNMLSFRAEKNTSMLDAIATLENLCVHVHSKDDKNKHGLKLLCVKGPKEGTPVYLYHTPGIATHFELMTLHEVRPTPRVVENKLTPPTSFYHSLSNLLFSTSSNNTNLHNSGSAHVSYHKT